MGLNASPFERYLDSGPFKGAGTHYPPEFFFDLGIRYYRTALKNELVRPEAPDLITAAFHKHGSRPLVLIDPGHCGLPADLVAELKRYPAGVIWGVEGPNEVNNKFPPQELNLKYKGKTDEAAAAAYMDDAVTAIRADPAARTPIVAFTAIFTDYRLARPHTSFDFANMHSYQGDDVPTSSLLMNETRFNCLYPAGTELRPFVPTECGYNVEEDVSNGTHLTGSRVAQALSIPRLYAEYFRHGIPRTFLFALHNADGFGLLESDQEKKRPSWYAVKNLVAQLSDAHWNEQTSQWDGKPVTPRALLFDVNGAPETLHSITLQKADGSFRLLIWNEVRLYDAGSKTELKPAPLPVSLTFRSSLEGDVQVLTQNAEGGYDSARLPTEENGRVLHLQVPASVMILTLHQNVKAGAPPAGVTGLRAEATENSVDLHWEAVAADPWTAGFFVFRNGAHVATLAPGQMQWQDRTPWVRPGLGYPYEIQSFDHDGRMSPRVRVVAVTPDKRPDLVVTAAGVIQDKIAPGDPVQFWATLKNVGTGATPFDLPTSVTFTVDKKTISWGGIQRPLQPGEEVRVEGGGGPRQPPVWAAEKGSHLLLARADDINRISEEVVKTNNWIDQTLIVGSASPGEILGSSGPAPESIDLSKGAWEDWIVWGVGDKNSAVKMTGSSGALGPLSFTGEGTMDRTVGGPVHISWNAGDPVSRSDGTNESLWMNTKGHAFHFDAAADEHERELTVYVAGLEGATGKFRAELSDASAPAYESSSWTGNLGQGNWAAVPAGFSAAFTVRYHAAKPKQQLHITWELADEPNRFLGQIRLQAATLRVLPK